MSSVLKDVVSFFRGHWMHVIIGIPAAFAFTALHEFTHCAAVRMQGGCITSFVWLPSGTEWGHVQYWFPPGVTYSAAAVSLGPYAAWLSSCLLAGLLSLRRGKWPFWCASTIFVWLFIVPLADIANAAAPYVLFDAQNDLRDAFGPTRPPFTIVAGMGALAVVAYGYPLSRRLYGDRSVGLPAYCVLAAAALIAVAAISTGRLV